MFGTTWTLVKESVNSFISDEALTRGAAIAFYTVTSIGPVLLIVIAIAGLAFVIGARSDSRRDLIPYVASMVGAITFGIL